MSVRRFLTVNGVRLACIDFGGGGEPLLALHGHFSCARTFAGLAEALQGRWRVVAPDQRGHGWSDSPGDYSREAYVADAVALIRRFQLAPAVVLGHSLGGLNAYQLAAWHPELVRALIVEEIGAVMPADELTCATADWPERFPSVRSVLDLLAAKGVANPTYFLESLVEHKEGWAFRFQYDHLHRSRQLLRGDWWADWLSSTCPALLLHGHKSWALTTKQAREMAARRPNTQLVEFPECGHTIHDEDPAGFQRAVESFLDSLE